MSRLRAEVRSSAGRASDVISMLPATSTLLGVGRLGYEAQLVESEAVPVLD